jgi:hypothetical protein
LDLVGRKRGGQSQHYLALCELCSSVT